jgi:hypothetical protein
LSPGGDIFGPNFAHSRRMRDVRIFPQLLN